MKKLIVLSSFLAFATVSGYSQVTPSTNANNAVLVAPKVVEKPKQEKTVPLSPPKMTNAVLGKPVTYGGYITDVVRAPKKRALFDLSAPLDPQKDLENVFFNSNQDLAQPIVLFRMKF